MNDINTQPICKRNRVGYSLHSQTGFLLLQVKSVNYNLKTLQYFGPNILPNDIKNSTTLQEFSKKVSWILRSCPCKNLWKLHIYILSRFYKYLRQLKKCQIFNTYFKYNMYFASNYFMNLWIFGYFTCKYDLHLQNILCYSFIISLVLLVFMVISHYPVTNLPSFKTSWQNK